MDQELLSLLGSAGPVGILFLWLYSRLNALELAFKQHCDNFIHKKR